MLTTENQLVLRKRAEMYKHSEIRNRYSGHGFLITDLSPDFNSSILFSSRLRTKQDTDQVYCKVYEVWFVFLSSLPLYFHIVLPSLRKAQKHNEWCMSSAWSLQALSASLSCRDLQNAVCRQREARQTSASGHFSNAALRTTPW